MLVHQLLGTVTPLEAAYSLGKKVLVTRSGDGDIRNLFVDSAMWSSPLAEITAEWERLRGFGNVALS